MNAKEFKTAVAIAAREQPRQAVEWAVNCILEDYPEPYDAAQVRRTVQLAGRFAASQVTEAGRTPITQAPRPHDIVASDMLCDRLEPRILALRLRAFGTERVPFHTDRAAVRWIEETVVEESRLWPPMPDQGKLNRLVDRLQEMTGRDVELKVQFLAYPKPPSEWIHRAPAAPGGKLYGLARECESIANGSGFPEVSILWWILRGIRPIIPRYTVTRSFRSPGPQYLVLMINGPDLTWREAWNLFKHLERTRGKMVRPINPLQARAFQLVESRGGIPAGHGSKGALWESVRLDLVKEFGKRAPTTWQAVRKAYFAAVSRRSSGRMSETIK